MFTQRKSSQWCLLRGLQNNRVAGSNRRCEFPRSHQQRIIPRCNRRDHTDWIATNEARKTLQIFTRQRPGLLANRTGKKSKHIGNRRYLVIARTVDRFATIGRLELCEHVAIFFNPIGNPEQNITALFRRSFTPCIKCRSRGLNRSIHLIRRSFIHGADHLTRCRIDDLLLAALTLNKFAVNE